jgi:MFS family permease
MFGTLLYLPLFGQGVIGLSTANVGFVMTPLVLSMVTMSIGSGQIISRTGKYKPIAIVGVVLITIGMFLFSTMGVGTTHGALVFNMIVSGLGLGMLMPIFYVLVQSAFGQEKIGVLTASIQLFRSIGGSAGAAFFGGILNNGLVRHLQGLHAEPFAKISEQISGKPLVLNPDTIQQFLSPQGRDAVRATFKALPPQMAAQAEESLGHFVAAVRVAFSDSLSAMYTTGAFLMVFACLLVFALPVIPLRASKRPALEEAGVELEQELGMSNPKHEPT